MLNLFQRSVGILHRIVEKTSDDGGAVELHARQKFGHAQRMGEIGIAGIPSLRAMRLEREDISPVEGVLVSRGVVGLDALDQFELPDHPVTLVRIVVARLLGWRSFAPSL